MKFVPALVLIALVALGIPACTTAPKKQEASCCSAKGDCEAPAKKHKH